VDAGVADGNKSWIVVGDGVLVGEEVFVAAPASVTLESQGKEYAAINTERAKNMPHTIVKPKPRIAAARIIFLLSILFLNLHLLLDGTFYFQ
jgi:hypothetical protein